MAGERILTVDWDGSTGKWTLGEFKGHVLADGQYLQLQKESTSQQSMGFGEQFKSRASWELNPAHQLVNCAQPHQVFGFHFRRLFAVPRDEILQPAPAQPQESSLVLYPSAVKDSEDAAVTSMLADGNIVCLYNSALEQVVVNKYMGDLSYYRPSTTGRQMQRQALGLKMRQICFVEKETFLADQHRDTAAKLLKYEDLMSEGCRKQQLLDAALAKLDAEQANTMRLHSQHDQREAEYTEMQQELSRTQARLVEEQDALSRMTESKGNTEQEAKIRVAGLEAQLGTSAEKLAIKQVELAAAQQLSQLSAAAAREAEATVALLEARLLASQETELQLAEMQQLAQAEIAKLLPWSPAMAPLFIDPSKLNQGGLLGLSSSGANRHTYSGTYIRTDGCQPIQAGMGGFEEGVRKVWQASADSHHICRIYGVSCLNRKACLVMMLYPESLASRMSSTSGRLGNKRQLPIKTVVQWGVDICRGLQDLHAAGIIMQNLDQANVLITSNGLAVLADPSLSQDCHNGNNHHPELDSRLPEMSHGHGTLTCKADIYTLGCLLVEMCTGQPWAAGVLTLKVFHLEGDSAEPSLINVIRRCLCRVPEERPTAAINQKDLEALDLQVDSRPMWAEAPDASSPISPVCASLKITHV
ncbi:hypothetical protein ABBQ38_008211 [Trebouxia sp. C0009 RCD-2024]